MTDEAFNFLPPLDGGGAFYTPHPRVIPLPAVETRIS